MQCSGHTSDVRLLLAYSPGRHAATTLSDSVSGAQSPWSTCRSSLCARAREKRVSGVVALVVEVHALCLHLTVTKEHDVWCRPCVRKESTGVVAIQRMLSTPHDCVCLGFRQSVEHHGLAVGCSQDTDGSVRVGCTHKFRLAVSGRDKLENKNCASRRFHWTEDQRTL